MIFFLSFRSVSRYGVLHLLALFELLPLLFFMWSEVNEDSIDPRFLYSKVPHHLGPVAICSPKRYISIRA